MNNTPCDTIEEAMEKGYYFGFSDKVISWMKEIGYICADMMTKDHKEGEDNEITLSSGRTYYYRFGPTKKGPYCMIQPTWAVSARDEFFSLNIFYTHDKKFFVIPTH